MKTVEQAIAGGVHALLSEIYKNTGYQAHSVAISLDDPPFDRIAMSALGNAAMSEDGHSVAVDSVALDILGISVIVKRESVREGARKIVKRMGGVL